MVKGKGVIDQQHVGSEAPRHYRYRSLAVAVCLALAATIQVRVALSADTIATSDISGVAAFGLAPSGGPAYAGTNGGLYRSAGPPYAAWTQQQGDQGYYDAIAVSASNPDDLVYHSDGPSSGLFRSLNGGRDAVRVSTCPVYTRAAEIALVRSIQTPKILYAGGDCPRRAYILRSGDDGRTWQPVYDGQEAVALALDTRNPDHVLAGTPAAIIETWNAGRTWHTIMHNPLARSGGGHPNAMAIDPRDSRDIWVAWGTGPSSGTRLYQSHDGGHHWTLVTAGLPSGPSVAALSFDPISDRLYAAMWWNDENGNGPYSSVYAAGPEQLFQLFLQHPAPSSGPNGPGYVLAITPSGYLLSSGLEYPLLATPLLGPGLWAVASALGQVVPSVYGPRILGEPLSPLTCQACAEPLRRQYFAKGCVEGTLTASARMIRAAHLCAIVPILLAARAGLPIGANTSTVTYRSLAAWADPRRRLPPPEPGHTGIVEMLHGTFIPYTSALRPVPGYLVPPYFWQFMTSRSMAPHGWLQDVGRPLTPAVSAVVRKGSVQRHIVLQAFQRAILTYDQANPDAYRVERANIGADFVAAFPGQAR